MWSNSRPSKVSGVADTWVCRSNRKVATRCVTSLSSWTRAWSPSLSAFTNCSNWTNEELGEPGGTPVGSSLTPRVCGDLIVAGLFCCKNVVCFRDSWNTLHNTEVKHGSDAQKVFNEGAEVITTENFAVWNIKSGYRILLLNYKKVKAWLTQKSLLEPTPNSWILKQEFHKTVGYRQLPK